jgi:hypothetical protein
LLPLRFHIDPTGDETAGRLEAEVTEAAKIDQSVSSAPPTPLAEASKIEERWPAAPSDRANWNVTHTSRPLMLARWLVVGLAVPVMLVLVPLFDLVRASVKRLGHLLTACLSIRS